MLLSVHTVSLWEMLLADSHGPRCTLDTFELLLASEECRFGSRFDITVRLDDALA